MNVLKRNPAAAILSYRCRFLSHLLNEGQWQCRLIWKERAALRFVNVPERLLQEKTSQRVSSRGRRFLERNVVFVLVAGLRESDIARLTMLTIGIFRENSLRYAYLGAVEDIHINISLLHNSLHVAPGLSHSLS
jgi:hypothetical protein